MQPNSTYVDPNVLQSQNLQCYYNQQIQYLAVVKIHIAITSNDRQIVITVNSA